MKPVIRKTIIVPEDIHDKLSEWKGGERKGISFAESIDRLVDYAVKTGYGSAMASPKKSRRRSK